MATDEPVSFPSTAPQSPFMQTPTKGKERSQKTEKRGGVQASNLISFRFESSPRDSFDPSSRHHNHNNRGNGGNGNLSNNNHRRSRGNSLTKDEYVLSHFRFIVNPLVDPFESCWYQPDATIPWDLVESVIVSINQENTMICPICLDLVQYPKTTKCGHCFCYLCIIRHMKCDRSNRLKCPMCLENIYLRDLKSVKYENNVSHAYVTKAEYEHYYEENPNFQRSLSIQRQFKLQKQQRKNKGKSSVEENTTKRDGEMADALPDSESAAIGKAEETEECGQYVKFRHISVTKGNISPQLLYLRSSVVNSNVNSNSVSGVKSLFEQLQLLHQAIPLEGTPESIYSRIMYRSVPDMLLSFQREKEELTSLLKEYQGFINEFLGQNKQRGMQILSDEDDSDEYNPYREYQKNIKYVQVGLEILLQREEKFQLLLGQFICEESFLINPLVQLLSVNPQQTITSNDPMQASNNNTNGAELISSFYQSENGSFAFIHPLCLRCLSDYYLSITEQPSPIFSTDSNLQTNPTTQHPFPEYIIGRILEVERIRITTSIKQRYSFLRHLPLHLEIELIEIDVKSLVSKVIYQKFMNEIQKRLNKRIEKKKLESIQIKLQEEKRIKQEVELQERLLQYNDLRMNKGHSYTFAVFSNAVSLSTSDFPLATGSPTSLKDSNNERKENCLNGNESIMMDNGENVSLPVSNFNSEGRISFAEITQLSGNFPALVSSSVASLNPLPSFPSLNQSHVQSQGGKPSIGSINNNASAKSGGNLSTPTSASAVVWGKSPVKAMKNEQIASSEDESSTVMQISSSPPSNASQKSNHGGSGKKSKVSLLSTSSTRNYRG